ncbi:Hypothetical predicted protein [Olea europaea subsp. europaea]|uniref:Uncharacterized protein n=1 Tax=Olea europaea subsp. europaea TaxID=158383 RepID=A0A8S0T1Q6_OLEEU|nr:Hypothetical predicted protein [Olea europaea subsp. europaea]
MEMLLGMVVVVNNEGTAEGGEEKSTTVAVEIEDASALSSDVYWRDFVSWWKIEKWRSEAMKQHRLATGYPVLR